MNIPTFKILEPGLLTTIQDRGRYGYQKYGVPVSGAMDQFAMRASNILVGNDENAAVLEMTALGPKIEFITDTYISITGANLTANLDNIPIPSWETIKTTRGSNLIFNEIQDGMRAYLAIAGGIDVPLVLGSRSTNIQSTFGGLEGRSLKKGDIISALLPIDAKVDFRKLPDGYLIPKYGEYHEIRIILSPQENIFVSEASQTITKSKYIISSESDRMGYKLEGPKLLHQNGPDIISEGNAPGTIQVSGDGQPTILLADRGTTGGYTKIATVISTDISKLAQALPGQALTFKSVTREEANISFYEQEKILEMMSSKDELDVNLYRGQTISVDGRMFEIQNDTGNLTEISQSIANTNSKQKYSAKATVNNTTHDFEIEVGRKS